MATGAIALCLSARHAEDGDEAFRGSTLTGDGFPLEFGVSALDPRLRFTCEPGSRNLPPMARMQLAAKLAGQLGGKTLPAHLLATLRWAQQGADLAYGGWLGARIDDKGAVQAKLYAELSPDRPPPMLGEYVPRLPYRPVEPRMLGIDCDGQAELYLRLPSLLPAELPALLAPAGMEARADEVVALLSKSYGQPFRDRLPGSSVGVSYAAGDSGCAVTLYFFARALWGGDARIRQRFAALIADPAQRETYWRATAPLAGRDLWQTRHGLAGLVLRPAALPSWVVGFRPEAAV